MNKPDDCSVQIRNWVKYQETQRQRQKTKHGGSGGARTRHKSNNDGPFAATPSQIASQKPVSPGHDLSRVVAAWSKLPSPFKAAILAIVNSAEGQP